MRPTISLRKALSDPNLLGRALAGVSWCAWRILLIAAMGEALTDEERETFKQLTGRDHEPLQRVDQFAAVIGRRGGKSRAIATLATYIAALCEHEALVPGEKGVLLCVALDQRVAKIILDYCQATLEQSPILRQLIAGPHERHARVDQRRFDRGEARILQKIERSDLRRSHLRRACLLVHRQRVRESGH